MSDLDRTIFVEVRVELQDVGGEGYRLVECIDREGRRSFWLHDLDYEGSFRTVFPEHEYVGRIPDRMQWAINSPRCGQLAPTTGIPCRRRVSFLGDRCHAHRGGAE